MNKHCEVIIRDDALFVFGNVETQPGVRITGQSITKLPANAAPEDLGRAVLTTLESYQVGVKHPTREEWKAREQDGLRGTGFSNWRSLTKGAFRLGVQSDGSSVVVTPTVTDGRGGYMDIVDAPVTSTSEPKLVGEAILNAKQLCQKKSKLP